VARVCHQRAKEIGQVLEGTLGAFRIAADERQDGVQAIEQKVRPDARLQRLQARLGERRRERLGVQPEVREKQHGGERGQDNGAGGARHGNCGDRQYRAMVEPRDCDGERNRRRPAAPHGEARQNAGGEEKGEQFDEE